MTKSLLKLAALLTFLVGAVYFFRFTDTGRAFTPDRVAAQLRDLHPLLTPLAYVLLYVFGTALLVPGLLLSFLGAMLFNLWEATLYTWIGATLGASACFLLAKALGREFVEKLLGGKLQALDQKLRERGFISLLVIRLVPLFPFNVVNFGCGITSLKLRDYALATAIGIIPGTFVYQYLFAKLGRKVLDEGFAWSDLADMEVMAPVILFAVFVVATGIVARRMSKT